LPKQYFPIPNSKESNLPFQNFASFLTNITLAIFSWRFRSSKMKCLNLFSTLLLALLCSAFLSCHNNASNQVHDYLANLSKIEILIYECGFSDYPEKNMSLYVSFFIINNSDDTLRYTNTRSLFSRFYCTDNTKMTVADDPLPRDSIQRVVIPPHKGKYAYIYLKLGKSDMNFKFRIGMKLLRWHASNSKTILAEIAHDKQDTIWSNVKIFNTTKNHSVSAPAEDQYQARILEKVLPAFFSSLTDGDKKNYTLSIDQNKIKQLKETIVDTVDVRNKMLLKKKSRVAICEMQIHNNSNDTLKYASMSCSWLETYVTDNVDFKIPEQICLQNIPELRVIPPRQSSIVEIPIVTDLKTALPRKIKIGLSLQKCTEDPFNTVPGLFEMVLKPLTRNMIWSNEVEIH